MGGGPQERPAGGRRRCDRPEHRHVRQAGAQGTPSGATPDQAAQAVVHAVGAEVPGSPDTRQNRLEGLGPLSGLAVGMPVGALGGALRTGSVKLPFALAASALGLGAMTMGDGVMTGLGITDPRTWTPATVVSDVVPHLASGATTVLALHRMVVPRTVQVP